MLRDFFVAGTVRTRSRFTALLLGPVRGRGRSEPAASPAAAATASRRRPPCCLVLQPRLSVWPASEGRGPCQRSRVPKAGRRGWRSWRTGSRLASAGPEPRRRALAYLRGLLAP